MNSHIDAKRGQGIDEVIAKLHPAPLEDIKKLTVLNPPDYAQLFQVYEQMLYFSAGGMGSKGLELQAANAFGIAELISDVLSPLQIQGILQSTIAYENHQNYSTVTGIFVTRLIQNSFNAGYNDFVLHVPGEEEHRLKYFGGKLEGRSGQRVSLAVEGDVGINFCWKTRYCNVVSHGNARIGYGEGAQESRFEHYGNSIFPAKNCAHCEFVFHGPIKSFELASGMTQNTLFKTSNREALGVLLLTIPHDKGNKIYFIDEYGKAILRRDT